MRPHVEGQSIDGADYSLRERGSNQLASFPMGSIAYYATRDRRILFIHGYNVEERSGQNAMIDLRNRLVEGCPALEREILTVTWPGNESWLRGGPAAYFAKVPVARDAGRLLYRSLIAESSNGLGARQIVIVAHSLGCRVTLEFLRLLERSLRPPELEKVAIILMAAAVPTHLTDLIESARRNADEISVLHSTSDKILRRWFRLGQTVAREGHFPEAVGLKGNPHDPPWSHHRHMEGYNHGDYWVKPLTAEVIGEQLMAYFPEIVYRSVDLRSSTIHERAVPDDIGYLSEHSLSQF